MARNKEKQYGKLNRLHLLNEKEEYEKKNPKRPRLETLMTVEEIQEWLPSIKKDIDFYLKKSQVTCYSDAHVEECRENVVKLEKEFKAFVRKIKQVAPYPVETTPWTSRPYERKRIDAPPEDFSTEFRPIPTPILEKNANPVVTPPVVENVYLPLNDKPLEFTFKPLKVLDETDQHSLTDKRNISNENSTSVSSLEQDLKKYCYDDKQKTSVNLVNYDSSGSES